MGFPLAPWHMWGSTQRTTLVTAAGLALVRSPPVQLARINYARPETWSFFLGAQLTAIDSGAFNVTLGVTFSLITGVGRTVFQTPIDVAGLPQNAFVLMQWPVIPPGTLSPDAVQDAYRWTTQARSSELDSVGEPGVRLPLMWFPAQDIQCSATAVMGAGGAASASLALTAFFAPRTHVRPEWFSEKGDQFRGQEQGGS